LQIGALRSREVPIIILRVLDDQPYWSIGNRGDWVAANIGTIRIGNRPLHIAIGAGHRNATGGNLFEADLNGRVCNAVLALARASDGFDIRCYTPEEGLGVHPGPVDAGPREVASVWDPGWRVDVLHEVHAQAVPSRPQERGVFVIYPDGAGLTSAGANPGEIDADIKAYGPVMARILATATSLPVGGPGVMSERQTLVGQDGRRLRIFDATATHDMVARSCRFISEVGCHTNPQDRAIMTRPDFPRRQAVGILRAYAALARAQLGWSYPYRFADDTN
jgi:hypothetical protein